MAVYRTIEAQIQEACRAQSMSFEDTELCLALLGAIRSVQDPNLFEPLPKKLRDSVLKWHQARDKRHLSRPDVVTMTVEYVERTRGLKRNRQPTKKNNGDTAYAAAARMLGLKTNTVIKKTKARKSAKTSN